MSMLPSISPVAELNDAFRTGTASVDTRGEVMITPGVTELGADKLSRIAQAVRDYNDFGEGNDPYGDHDFGALTIDGADIFWKIDCYNITLDDGSPDPTDPSVTRRVMTIMLASEY